MSEYGTGQPGIEWTDPTPPWADEPALVPAPASHRRPSRNPLARLGMRAWVIIGAVVVLAVAGAGTWYLVKPQPPVKITFNGAAVDNAKPLLQTTDTAFLRYAHDQLGTVSAQSRCYFERAGQSVRTDVTDKILCGPVLFFESKPETPYLTYTVSDQGATHAGHVTLSADNTPDTLQVAPSSIGDLVRPDRRHAPRATGGLSVPVPPPAAANLLTTVAQTDLDNLTPAAPDATITGRNVGLRLSGYGVVASYGHAAKAHSAAAGQKLVGFAIDTMGGEVGLAAASAVHLSLSVNGGRARAFAAPVAYGVATYYIASVPAAATAVDLVLTEAGMAQHISLLNGKPGAMNVAVLRRSTLFEPIEDSGSAVAQVDAGGDVFTAPLTVHAYVASLEYFTPSGTLPSGPQRAFLYVEVCFQSSVFVDPKACHGLRGTDMQLTPTGGHPITGRNLGRNNATYPVFEVPASFTTGTVTVIGSESSGDGWSMTVTSPYSFKVSFPS